MAKIVKFADGRFGYRRTGYWFGFPEHEFLSVGSYPVWKSVRSNDDVPSDCKGWSEDTVRQAIKQRDENQDRMWSTKDHGSKLPKQGLFYKLYSLIMFLRGPKS